MRAVNLTRKATLIENGQVADNPWRRLRGLLGHAPLRPGEGLLLRGEKSIHTIGMSFAIDVLFLDREGVVVQLYHALPPLRLSSFEMRAVDVLELPPGVLAQTGTARGDRIQIDFTF